MTPTYRERRVSRRFGWLSLAAWAAAGLGLETAHGLKLADYLDDEVTRLLLTLAHAHGVALALVVLVYSSAGTPLFASRADGGRSVGRVLRGAALALPLILAAAAPGHPEGDPNALIFLLPVAALALVGALFAIALEALRDTEGQEPKDG